MACGIFPVGATTTVREDGSLVADEGTVVVETLTVLPPNCVDTMVGTAVEATGARVTVGCAAAFADR